MFKVIIEKDNEKEIYSEVDNIDEAERDFLNAVENTISNFDDYTSDDIDEMVYNQYEYFGRGVIYIETDGLDPF